MTDTAEHSTSVFRGYACPATHAPLDVVDGERLASSQTDHVYPVDDGVPNFLQYPSVESADVVTRLQKLVASAKQHGCENALRQVDAQSLPYLLDESRAKYLELLPLTDDSQVLEVGASKGQHTRLIAPRCKSLYALETVKEQAAFGSLWCSELGHSNVKFAAGGDDCRLPYLDGLFDTVVLNLVFEWCAGRANEAFSAAQTRMLAECHRVLAPGGCLFMSTKNRYSARLLTGAVDEHTGLRFGNALPRWLMNLGLRLKGETTPRGVLYSYGGLKKIVFSCGFDRVESYWATPNARHPKAYVHHDRSAIAAARKDSELLQVDRLSRILLKYAPDYLIERLAPSHVFLAYKS